MGFKNMIKWGKTTKIVSIVAIALGGSLTIAGAAMLGVSGNKTYTIDMGATTPASIGIGFSNYASVNGQFQPGVERPSYENYIKIWKDSVKDPSAPKEAKDLVDALIQTYDIMLAGAVLLPIGTIMAIIGTIFLILNIKKQA